MAGGVRVVAAVGIVGPVATYLDGILAAHRDRARHEVRVLDAMIGEALVAPAPRGFTDALVGTSGLGVISEIKRRSPSKGDLARHLDPSLLAQRYEQGGATCLSVLTDEEFFAGSVADLLAAREACGIPVLRKDFTVDARDICEARIIGADCVLLIAAALDDAELADFHRLANELSLDALVEVHDEAELERALTVGAMLVGVNQRDLVTFAVDTDRAARVAHLIPDNVVRVAESGVRGPDDGARLAEVGYHAVLVGESLVTAADPVGAVRALRSVSRRYPSGPPLDADDPIRQPQE